MASGIASCYVIDIAHKEKYYLDTYLKILVCKKIKISAVFITQFWSRLLRVRTRLVESASLFAINHLREKLHLYYEFAARQQLLNNVIRFYNRQCISRRNSLFTTGADKVKVEVIEVIANRFLRDF